MKILVLAPPMTASGGVQKYTATLVRALAEIAGEKNVRMVSVPSEPKIRSDGTTSLGSFTKLRFFFRAISIAIIFRPQFVFCTHIGVAPVARIIQRITGIPYWIILHGIEVWGELPPQKIQALRNAQQLVAVSRFTLDAATAQHHLTAKNAAILHPALFSIPQQPASARKIAAETQMVLTVARLAASERYKGHDVMLDAWPAVLREIPAAKYIIVGDGDDRARLENRVREMGLNNSVVFKGTLSGVELDSCYDECRVFALPARTELDPDSPRGEGFGIVFLEAMAHGKPVVGPNVGAPAEFIHSGVHGLLVAPSNAGHLAAALIELLQHPQLAQEMGRAARDWVNQQFSSEKFRERLSGILRVNSYKA